MDGKFSAALVVSLLGTVGDMMSLAHSDVQMVVQCFESGFHVLNEGGSRDLVVRKLQSNKSLSGLFQVK